MPAANIALTLALYLTLYGALLYAYVSVLVHLARKGAPSDAVLAPADDADAGARSGGAQHV